jgi:hypothetical protein
MPPGESNNVRATAMPVLYAIKNGELFSTWHRSSPLAVLLGHLVRSCPPHALPVLHQVGLGCLMRYLDTGHPSLYSPPFSIYISTSKSWYSTLELSSH